MFSGCKQQLSCHSKLAVTSTNRFFFRDTGASSFVLLLCELFPGDASPGLQLSSVPVCSCVFLPSVVSTASETHALLYLSQVDLATAEDLTFFAIKNIEFLPQYLSGYCPFLL